MRCKSAKKVSTLEYLSKASTWVLDIAGKIGVNVATEALKKAITP